MPHGMISVKNGERENKSGDVPSVKQPSAERLIELQNTPTTASESR
jgi:hypothetical protein